MEAEATDPFFNMGMDEALLNFIGTCPGPVFRFYWWKVPAATFGLLQRFEEVSRWTCVRPLIRRPTGGGLVLHGTDWTYSIVIPPSGPWFRKKAEQIYEDVHRLVVSAFRRLGILATLAESSEKLIRGMCFAGPERMDVVLDGQKIAGIAMRRTKMGLMLQGSIRPVKGIDFRQWLAAFKEAAHEAYSVSWAEFTPKSEQVQFAWFLASNRYASADYTQCR